jgi:Putative regulator of cell autolysis
MRSKILILCLGSTFFALILQSMLFQEMSSNLIYNQTKQESFNSLQNMQNDIYRYVNNMESNLIEVYNNKDLIQDLKMSVPITVLKSKFNRIAYNMGANNFETTDGVVAIYLYDKNDNIISTYRRAVTPKHNYETDIYNEIKYENAQIVKDYVRSDEVKMLISSYYNKYRETDIVRLVLKLYNNGNHRNVIGYVVCDVDSKVLRKIMEKYSSDKSMFIWLQPMGDRTILSIGNLQDNDANSYQKISEDIQNGTKKIDVSLKKSSRIFFSVDQEKYNISAYSLMPHELLVQNQKILTKNLIIVSILMLIAVTLLTIPVTKNLTNSLEKLMKIMERIKNGDTRLRVTIKKEDEFGELGKTFNDMLDRMESLISKEYESKLLLNRAEYKALQAQINPHFLYNTLETMSSIADIQGCKEISGLSLSLSNIFRYSLDMKNPFSTVAKEIVHLKNYIYVMDVRIRNNISYQFDIDEQVLQDTIPRLSIQPIVENALTHGLRNVRGEKNVSITAKIHDDNLMIIVEDNGVGMDALQVNQALQENSLEMVEKGNSIGLNNINARLKMLYGESYGLHIESEKNQGTKVFLVIPRVKMEEADPWNQNYIRS